MTMFNGESIKADKFVVRMPDGMRDQITALADSHHRSMNSEIVARLQDSIAAEDPRRAGICHTDLTSEEKSIVLAVRELSRGKRKALLTLLASAS
jgi:plasmid stability protein